MQGDLLTGHSRPSDWMHWEWQLLEPKMPALKTGGRLSSVPWSSLPHNLPAWFTVYHYFRLWRFKGSAFERSSFAIGGGSPRRWI